MSDVIGRDQSCVYVNFLDDWWQSMPGSGAAGHGSWFRIFRGAGNPWKCLNYNVVSRF